MGDLNHYLRKTAIARAIIDGTPATALCGETLVPEHQGGDAVPGNEIQSRTLKECPMCVLLRGALPEKRTVKEPADAPALS